MIFKRKSEEEKFAEALAKELERQAKEMEKSLTPEAKERLRLMQKSPAWSSAEERIARGEIKLYWRKIGDDLYIVARDTIKNFPFKRYNDYLLLPSGLDDYMHSHPPLDIDWIQANADTWRPRPLASFRWLDEPITLAGYDEYNVVPYECVIEARDRRQFLVRALECLLLELANGSRTAYDIARKAAAAYADGLWKHGLAEAVQKGEISKEEAKKHSRNCPNALS